LSLVAAALISTPSSANPRPLPFTYTAQTLPEGETEIEQYADLTPVRARSAASGAPVTLLGVQFQTEFEYGITDRLELGLYVAMAPTAGESYTQVPALTWGNGIKQRLRWHLADEGQWPIDVALYGEVAEMQNELEIEGKIILERRFGDLRIAANLWAEHEFYLDKPVHAWLLNPTLGVSYQVTPVFHPGIEGWMRAEIEDVHAFNIGPHAYVGPTVLLSFGQLWWSTGVYLRATDFDRSPQPGDSFGAVWARTIVGVGL
jgi:hypothetical protein